MNEVRWVGGDWVCPCHTVPTIPQCSDKQAMTVFKKQEFLCCLKSPLNVVLNSLGMVRTL